MTFLQLQKDVSYIVAFHCSWCDLQQHTPVAYLVQLLREKLHNYTGFHVTKPYPHP
jgi:hypothetical protein